MTENFFALPKSKQEAIINAGFRVFSQNSYKKSPMSEIADAAGISKSLLFHYFYNKRELYLFLWDKCMEITTSSLKENLSFHSDDLFEMMFRGLKIKADIMRQYPDLGTFVVKSYYEKDSDVCEAIQKIHRFQGKSFFGIVKYRTVYSGTRPADDVQNNVLGV